MEKITMGFIHFFVYYVVREMGGEKWKKLTFFHEGKIQTYNNITKYAKFSNVFCGRTETVSYTHLTLPTNSRV